MEYIIRRFSQKASSLWDDTLEWAKKFTPKIPLPDKSRLVILGPWTIAGGVVGFFKGLASKIKHYIKGTPSKEHIGDHKEEPREKQFSETLDFKEYCKLIPGYKELCALSTFNFRILKKLSTENRKFIWKYFPSFLVVANPETINEYRKDFREKYGQDYSEILFAYGNEIDFVWDFDKEGWYVRDHTYTPLKEYKVTNNDILGAIKAVFDPSKNPLLKARVDKWMGEEKFASQFNMQEYCNIILEMIDIFLMRK